MAAPGRKAKGLTRKQRRLLAEVEQLASGLNLDHWNVEQRKPDDRIVFLEVVRDKLIRAEVVTKYTLIDEYLTDIICNYYFGRPDRGTFYSKLWRRKDFTIFVHYLMDETYLLKKLSIVRAIRTGPKDVVSAVSRINDLRNDLAHGLFPQNRRRYAATGKKVFYDGIHLYSIEGVAKFQADFHLASRYFEKRAFGTR